MSRSFEELDYRPTPIGTLSLRRRRHPSLGTDVYEIKLGEEFLMSSLFTEAEITLARLGLSEVSGTDLDVLVGGLGLGYTAVAALESPAVRSVTVVEALADVIDWHERGLLPLGGKLTGDPRCRLVHVDFFALLNKPPHALDPEYPDRRFHAVLVDIDHSPRALLHESHAALYTPEGLCRLAGNLHPGGVFALWSDDPPDEDFLAALQATFASAVGHVVSFRHPLQDREAANTIYIARTSLGDVADAGRHCR